jgi:hypothetical protein
MLGACGTSETAQAAATWWGRSYEDLQIPQAFWRIY